MNKNVHIYSKILFSCDNEIITFAGKWLGMKVITLTKSKPDAHKCHVFSLHLYAYMHALVGVGRRVEAV